MICFFYGNKAGLEEAVKIQQDWFSQPGKSFVEMEVRNCWSRRTLWHHTNGKLNSTKACHPTGFDLKLGTQNPRRIRFGERSVKCCLENGKWELVILGNSAAQKEEPQWPLNDRDVASSGDLFCGHRRHQQSFEGGEKRVLAGPGLLNRFSRQDTSRSSDSSGVVGTHRTGVISC